MAVQPQAHLYTVEEYLALDRNARDVRYEYYDGYIRMMSGGTNRHHIICANVISILNTALADSPCVVMTSDARVQIDAARYVYPDVTVTCDPAELGSDIVFGPVVLFEVLSPSTEGFDRGRKAEYYRMVPSVMEYVLIDQERMAVEVQRRHNETALWTLQNYGEGDTVTLTSLGVTLPIGDIYRKVVFPDPPTPDLPTNAVP